MNERNRVMKALTVLERIRRKYYYKDNTAEWAGRLALLVAKKYDVSQAARDDIEAFIKKHEGSPLKISDWAFHMCQAHIAHHAGFRSRTACSMRLNEDELPEDLRLW